MGYSIGVDFGSLSARAMAVDVSSGRILKESVYGYPHGIMKDSLPTGRKLEPGTALQDPRDYLDAWQFLIQDMFKGRELRADQVVGIGIDFTQCTVMPVDRREPRYACTGHSGMTLTAMLNFGCITVPRRRRMTSQERPVC